MLHDLDRKAIPKDLARSYGNNAGHYTDPLGRPLRSKPLLHRDPAVAVLPSPYETATARPVPPDGSGVLELVLDSAATMPVAAVDGTPVAVGDGTVYVVLPAGPHEVDVQSGATASPVVVDVSAGATAALVWREEVDRATVRFGPKAVDPLPPRSKVYLYEWAVIVLLVCGVPLALVNAFSLDETGSRIALGAVAVLALALLPFAPWRRRERERLAALRLANEGPGLARPVHYPWGGPDAADRPALVGDRPEALPEFAPGRGALLLRARGHRHLWKGGDGVVPRDAELASRRAAPPAVRIDGLELPATWGNWWYPLPPGKHTVEVEVETARSSVEFDVREGEATAIRADAHLYTRRGDDRGIVSDEPRLVLAAEEFRPEWMGDPARRLEYWS